MGWSGAFFGWGPIVLSDGVRRDIGVRAYVLLIGGGGDCFSSSSSSGAVGFWVVVCGGSIFILSNRPRFLSCRALRFLPRTFFFTGM